MFPIAITGLDESFELLYSVSDYFLSDPVVLIIVGVLVAGVLISTVFSIFRR